MTMQVPIAITMLSLFGLVVLFLPRDTRKTESIANRNEPHTEFVPSNIASGAQAFTSPNPDLVLLGQSKKGDFMVNDQKTEVDGTWDPTRSSSEPK